ncbi:helix-turn-helix domain-containing protein [Streptomyces sp. YGL11-2]|uniref:helix-turn-helix domain-containing protein n=1 Tax=Streptomyces sp. YGL11-2 TaxID=3414028 RepID=UPI003CEF6FA2
MSLDTMRRWRKAHQVPLHRPVRQPHIREPHSPDWAPPILSPVAGSADGRRRPQIFLRIVPFPTTDMVCRTLGLNQPAVTGQIQRLEKALGGP